MRNTRILAAALFAACSAAIFAGEPIHCADCDGKQSDAHPMCKVSYPIDGVIIPRAAKDVWSSGEEESEAILPCCPYPIPLGTNAKENSSNEPLIGTIMRLVQPNCWKSAGGNCEIASSSDGKSMIVNAPADVQSQVASILDSLRKNRNLNIAVETRLVSISDQMFKRSHLYEAFGLVGNDPARSPKLEQTSCRSSGHLPIQQATGLKSVILAEWQVYLFFNAAQNDERFNVIQAPRVTVYNGQTAHCDIYDIELPITGLKFESMDGQSRLIAQVQRDEIGQRFEMCPVLAPDQKSVSIRWRGTNSFPTTGHCETFPSYSEDDRSKIRWVSADFSVKPPASPRSDETPAVVPAVLPKFQTISADICATIPCDGTLMVYGGKVESIEESKCSIPILGDIPLLGSLFTSTEKKHFCDHYIWLVTPRIAPVPEVQAVPESVDSPEVPLPISPRSKCETTWPTFAEWLSSKCDEHANCQKCPCPGAEEESIAPPPPGVPSPGITRPAEIQQVQKVKSAVEMRAAKKAEKLMQEYRDACAAGDPEKAREYAREALDLDPECFTKPLALQSSAPPVPGARPQEANHLPVAAASDFWSKQTKEEITRDLLTPYMRVPLMPEVLSSPIQSPTGR